MEVIPRLGVSRPSLARVAEKRKLSNRLSNVQVRELVATFETRTTRMELVKRYTIGRTGVGCYDSGVNGTLKQIRVTGSWCGNCSAVALTI